MSQATAMFQSQLREAVRDAQAPGAAPAKPVPAEPAHRTVVRL